MSCLCFEYSLSYLSNLLILSFFTSNCGIYIIKLSLVTKKVELIKTSLYLIFHPLQTLLLVFSLTFSKICLMIFVCLAIS